MPQVHMLATDATPTVVIRKKLFHCAEEAQENIHP